MNEPLSPFADLGPKPKVAMAVYPGLTMLDMIGPHETFRELMEIHVLASTPEVISDSNFTFRPTGSFDDAPADFDVVFVPGGLGTGDALNDRKLLDFVADRGERARYVTSVCTGSLILGGAGLLKGYKATSHWAAMDSLAHFGAVPTEGRVVVDRNRITAGGITAGVDFGLTLVAEMFDEKAARLTQLIMEYDPDPPFDSGTPRTATQEDIDVVREYAKPLNEQIAAATSV